ncbi:MAG: NPCBM/NEW2 domain-containing protein, partial [Fibrobacter sp.]|nr:NPCBM/NEW2 domain-containing protein [Fibrobacter sp.]
RPWHFVGYGIASIHYDRARSMSNEELQSLVEKYQGEVYYIRGLDCWDSQTYHKKAVEHRIATTCDVFEREMDLVGVKNILITNNYWLQIAKFNGRKNYNPEKIISIAEPKVDAEIQDSLILKYDLNEKGDAADRWEFLLALNNKIEYRSDYKNAEGRYAVSTSVLLPGFNEIRYVVNDNATSKKLVDLTKFYFNPVDDALDLSRADYESNRQDWGDIKRNRSIEGHTLTVNGVQYANGYGVHASSETTFDVSRKYDHFRAMFGLDDESLCSEGVRVEIWGDNQMLASTPAFRNGVVYPVAVSIEGAQKLVIKTISVGNSIDCSHVDIINPMVSGLRK